MKNKRKCTPIQFLALHIPMFNERKDKKKLADARAALADRLFALSQPKKAQRL